MLFTAKGVEEQLRGSELKLASQYRVGLCSSYEVTGCGASFPWPRPSLN